MADQFFQSLAVDGFDQNVVKSGSTYNPALNIEECDTITAP